MQGLRFVESTAGFKLIFVWKTQSVSTLNVIPVVFCRKTVHPERPQILLLSAAPLFTKDDLPACVGTLGAAAISGGRSAMAEPA